MRKCLKTSLLPPKWHFQTELSDMRRKKGSLCFTSYKAGNSSEGALLLRTQALWVSTYTSILHSFKGTGVLSYIPSGTAEVARIRIIPLKTSPTSRLQWSLLKYRKGKYC